MLLFVIRGADVAAAVAAANAVGAIDVVAALVAVVAVVLTQIHHSEGPLRFTGRIHHLGSTQNKPNIHQKKPR